MQESSPVLHQVRTLHPEALQHIQQSQDGSLLSHGFRPGLQQQQPLHPDTIYHQQQYALNGPPHASSHALHFEHHGIPPAPAQYNYPTTSYQHTSSPRFAIANATSLQGHFQSPPSQPQQLPLPSTPTVPSAPQVISQRYDHSRPVPPQPPVQVELQIQGGGGDDNNPSSTGHGQFQGLKLIANPPDLEAWRQKLFNVDAMITLTEDEWVHLMPGLTYN